MRYPLRIFLLALLCLSTVFFGYGQKSYADLSVEDVVEAYPQRIAHLFENMDLDLPKLANVRTAIAKKDLLAASEGLLEYYKTSDGFDFLRNPDASKWGSKGGDKVVNDLFSAQGVEGKLRRNNDGTVDWGYTGPRDDEQWTHFLNRNSFHNSLLRAYKVTGDEKYTKRSSDLLIDFITNYPVPTAEEDNIPWMVMNSAMRFNIWPGLFYGTLASEQFTDAARLLMLMSVVEHAERVKKYHWAQHNHGLHELTGLAYIGVYWPELKNAKAWFDYGATHMLYELESQVLPDGVQNELTSMYHFVSSQYFEGVYKAAKVGNYELPAAFAVGVEKMYNYLAYIMRPDGHNLLNNDSDFGDYRQPIAAAAKNFARPDWEYIVSNGKKGTRPEKLSLVFPYAGHVIMRNGWNENSQWSYFDAGPYGWSHQNNDKLHLSVSAFGKDFLVDTGRYHYNTSLWRKYLASSFGHNVVLVDGFGQNADKKLFTKADSENLIFQAHENYDFSQATFDKGYQNVDDAITHTRSVVYAKNEFWVVLDELKSKKPHTIQPLWHFHPDQKVIEKSGSIVTQNADGKNLLILPIGETDWKAEVRFGPETIDESKYDYADQTPFDAFPIQGVYSPHYNEKAASATAVYTGKMDKSAVFGWLILPFEGGVVPEVEVSMEDLDATAITVKLEDEAFLIRVLDGEVVFEVK